MKRLTVSVCILLLLSLSAWAQEVRQEVTIQGSGFFPKETKDSDITSKPTYSGGVLAGYRFNIDDKKPLDDIAKSIDLPWYKEWTSKDAKLNRENIEHIYKELTGQITSGTVSCGGRAMTRGDTCVATGNGTSTERTYDQQKDQGQQGNYIAIGLGALIVVGAVFFTVAGARNRRTAGRAAPSAD